MQVCMYKPLPSQLKIVSKLNSLCSSLTESANFNGKKIENLKGSLKKATDTNKELKNTITSMNNRPKTINQDLENQSKCPFSVQKSFSCYVFSQYVNFHFCFVGFVKLHIYFFFLVHYTELRLRLAYQFTSYCEHLSLFKTLSLTNQ